MTHPELITTVRDYAQRHYNSNGWDVLVECWEDADIIAAITPHPTITTTDAAIRHIGKQLKLVHDYSRDIQAEAF